MNLNELYTLVKKNSENDLTIKELQYINLEVLSSIKEYLSFITVDDIKNIFDLSLEFWSKLPPNFNLEDLKIQAWGLNDKLFKQTMLDTYNEIILRLIITTTYNDGNKEDMEQALEFIEFLFIKLKKLSS